MVLVSALLLCVIETISLVWRVCISSLGSVYILLGTRIVLKVTHSIQRRTRLICRLGNFAG